ncbi:MAG: transporter [candidate division KSB1 bacterium]|nr:transporter [candidate division KSB1 bacterium]MDZ7274196.1 transporter [candidate division KSB1 bacterium]MDZ7287282.1 transporter [candidate division KSB1 bacterium]MDZ7296794.1 transporter [candidate division KSB1 bacterium]MDZ7347660.1 transporter [candidate division KSB1 bacterium]
MIQILLAQPLLLLFLVAAIGYPLGQIKIHGSSPGVAAVLFVGLAFGGLHPGLELPEIIYLLGLVIFVYTVGLGSGPGFFTSFRRSGLRNNLLVLGMLLLAMLLTVFWHFALRLPPALTAGLFAGSLTNTPALAGVLDQVKRSAGGPENQHLLTAPVIGYSLAYPMGVIGVLLAIYLLQRFWKIDYAREAASQRESGVLGARLQNRTLRVIQPHFFGLTLRELKTQQGWQVVFGRMKREGRLSLAGEQTRLQAGDLLSVVGTAEDLERVTAALGEVSNEHLDLDRSQLDYRRIFVSNPRVAGHRLRDLNLPQQYGAVITRVRRGDLEFLPHGDTVLELGDRIRVLTRRDHMEAVSAFFGDSYRALSEIDILTFSLGLALGLVAGLVPIPLPGGVVIRLGFAGGPLLVAMILATLRRTGPLVWHMPYSANLTLRQIGLILFLAGIGIRSGHAFFSMLTQGNSLALFAAGAGITLVVAFLTLLIGHRVLKIPMSILIGVLAGLQTQPAALGFALEQTRNDLPNLGYASVYPLAMIVKIILAQVLLTLLS